MRYELVKIWAGTATALVLVLFGVLIGRNTPTPSGVGGSEAVGPATEAAAFRTPDDFATIEREWRTQSDNATFAGYAILFDPSRREVVVEQCRHDGYFDDDDGQPVDQTAQYCDVVLAGTLTELSESSAIVATRSGNSVELTLSLVKRNNRQWLSVSFADHEMDLVPGSKNNLFQAMDRAPRMLDEKRRQIEFYAARSQRQRDLATTTE